MIRRTVVMIRNDGPLFLSNAALAGPGTPAPGGGSETPAVVTT
jgi:hypothetical protein